VLIPPNGRFAPQAAIPARSVFGTIETCLPARQISAYDFIDERNPVRVIDVFVDALDLAEISAFDGSEETRHDYEQGARLPDKPGILVLDSRH